MSKARVPLFQQPRNFVDITPEATVGATIGTNLYNADGTLFDLSQLTTGGSTTVINGVGYTHKKVADATYAITAADDKKIIEFTYAGAIAVTMSGLIPFSSGFDLVAFCSNASGQATFSDTNSMVITSSDSMKTRTQYSPVGLMVDETLQATLYGDIEAIAPALSVLGRSANSSGAPDYIEASANGLFLGRQSNIVDFYPVPPPTPLDTTLTYNLDGTLDVVTTASGTKTMGYTLGKLTSIVGTGIYPSKNFTYTGDNLTGIDVL